MRCIHLYKRDGRWRNPARRKTKSQTCRKLIAKIVTEEDRYWDEDGKIDENQGVDIN
jgi:hypothetical protein